MQSGWRQRRLPVREFVPRLVSAAGHMGICIRKERDAQPICCAFSRYAVRFSAA